MYDHERALVKDLKDKPFALVGVNYGDKKDDIRNAVKSKNLIWRSFFAGEDGDMFADYNVEGFPTVLILDEKGVVHFNGHETADDVIHKLLAKMEGGDADPEKPDDSDDDESDG